MEMKIKKKKKLALIKKSSVLVRDHTGSAGIYNNMIITIIIVLERDDDACQYFAIKHDLLSRFFLLLHLLCVYKKY